MPEQFAERIKKMIDNCVGWSAVQQSQIVINQPIKQPNNQQMSLAQLQQHFQAAPSVVSIVHQRFIAGVRRLNITDWNDQADYEDSLYEIAFREQDSRRHLLTLLGLYAPENGEIFE